MSYPKQNSVVKRLHVESQKDLHAAVDSGLSKIEKLWKATRQDLRNFVMDTYRRHFGSKPWDMASLQTSGAAQSLFGGIRNRAEAFKHYSVNEAKNQLNEVYKRSVMRHAWILDQLTPPSYKISVPHRFKLYEAAVNIYQGEEAARLWQARWTSWIDAYGDSLINNLRLGAINQSNMADSADEVDATRAGSPAYDLLDALNRIFESQAIYAVSAGERAIANANDGLVMEEIWVTSRDLRVCDICEPLDGLPIENAGMPPEHPNCRCGLRIVPVAWSDLLRSGTPEDRDLALEMEARGIVPESMAIRDEKGNILGQTVVDFTDWVSENFRVIVGQ